MKINFFINDDLNELVLYHFFLSLKRIQVLFKKMEDVELYANKKNLIILPKDSSIRSCEKILQKTHNFKLNNLCFFIPLNLTKYYKKLDFKSISYPIEVSYFETVLFNLFSKHRYFFKNLELMYDNNLVHIKKDKQVRLTEIESKIIKLLFSNKIVTKRKLNGEVLNQLPTIESKSLESHIYRLRKKILKVDNNTQIIALDNNNLKII